MVVPRLPFNFVPTTDSGVMQVNVRFPRGTPPLVVNQGTQRVETYLMQRPEVVTIQIRRGRRRAEVVVQLVPMGKRPGVPALTALYRQELLRLFRDQPSTTISVSAGSGFGGGFGPSLQLNVVSADFNTLNARNNAIIQELQANPYVTDVTSSLSLVTLENDFIPDPSRMKGTGITPNQVAQALQTYTTGTQASNVITGGISYPIQVQADPTTISGGQSLLNLPIYSPALQTTSGSDSWEISC